MQKGYKHSLATREKMRKIAFTRDNSPRIKALPKGNKHWNWTDKPNVLTMHKRLHRNYGKAKDKKCANNCGRMAHDWACMKQKYSDNILDYKPLCRSCHVKKDKNWIKK